MAFSEIDDIFASKGKAKRSPSAPPSSAIPTVLSVKKKNKQKKRKRNSVHSEAGSPTPRDAAKPLKSRPIPETVVDPSIQMATAPSSKRLRIDKTAGSQPAKQKSSKEDKEDEARFKDSRGSGPRRTTDEGFSIYKEDELGIRDEGGDTPLCPFDCDCCF